MSAAKWSAVDAYFSDRLQLSDPALDAVLAANAAAGLPAIDVSPAQGKFLSLIAKMIGARRILAGRIGARRIRAGRVTAGARRPAPALRLG